MSVEAISWALNLAPVPADRAGRPSSPCRFVLVGLANHAAPDGTGAFPSVATLVRYTSLSERTVRTCLDRLEAAGIIMPCDPDIIAARIKRADRRPQGWDLNLNLVRDEPSKAEPTSAPSASQALLAERLKYVREGHLDGVRPRHPVTSPVDNRSGEVQQLHPEAVTGCNLRRNGVQSAAQRGAVAAPEPYLEPYLEPPAARSHQREAPPADDDEGGGAIGEFFAGLGSAWPLSAEQRARLAPAVQAALDTGWTPGALAAFAGANVDGVRNPYAVMATRLAAGELPNPPGQRPSRPIWCGGCDERTRMLGFDTDAPAPCPRCKPGRTGWSGGSLPAPTTAPARLDDRDITRIVRSAQRARRSRRRSR